jgi:hypothetical protein
MADGQVADMGVGFTALAVIIGVVTLFLIKRQIKIGDDQKAVSGPKRPRQQTA